jgi:hypothetical protein
MSTVKSYQVLDTETGEVKNNFKYLEGRPKQYRFNGQNGQFNINGEKILQDPTGKPIKSFTIIPMAWRVFEENLFARGRKDLWAELFFVDDRNCVSAIMLNNTSLEELLRLESELYYDEIALNEICLTMTAEYVTSEKDGQKRAWYLTKLSWQPAPKEVVKQYAEFAQDFRIYREDTMTATAVYRFKSPNFFIPAVEPIAQIAEAAAE